MLRNFQDAMTLFDASLFSPQEFPKAAIKSVKVLLFSQGSPYACALYQSDTLNIRNTVEHVLWKSSQQGSKLNRLAATGGLCYFHQGLCLVVPYYPFAGSVGEWYQPTFSVIFGTMHTPFCWFRFSWLFGLIAWLSRRAMLFRSRDHT